MQLPTVILLALWRLVLSLFVANEFTSLEAIEEAFLEILSKAKKMMKKNKMSMTEKTFVWKYGGQSVKILASFNEWIEIPMIRQMDGTYVFTALVPSGTHEYLFVVDGNYFFDMEFSSTPNPFGGFNNVVDVKVIESILRRVSLISRASSALLRRRR